MYYLKKDISPLEILRSQNVLRTSLLVSRTLPSNVPRTFWDGHDVEFFKGLGDVILRTFPEHSPDSKVTLIQCWNSIRIIILVEVENSMINNIGSMLIIQCFSVLKRQILNQCWFLVSISLVELRLSIPHSTLKYGTFSWNVVSTCSSNNKLC